MGSFDVNGKVALVTGGARGIGLETARALHDRGASVAIVDLDAGDAEAAALGVGERAIGLAGDVTDLEAMHRVVDETVARLGRLDVVVANAGVAPKPMTLAAMPSDDVDRVIDVNLLGVYRTVQPALPHVIANRGHVVVASVYAFVNGVLMAPYAMGLSVLRGILNPLFDPAHRAQPHDQGRTARHRGERPLTVAGRVTPRHGHNPKGGRRAQWMNWSPCAATAAVSMVRAVTTPFWGAFISVTWKNSPNSSAPTASTYATCPGLPGSTMIAPTAGV
jgi:NAD(P)-dependent dehydrogenase (short-subunit alcohol dehydrogenase family)